MQVVCCAYLCRGQLERLNIEACGGIDRQCVGYLELTAYVKRLVDIVDSLQMIFFVFVVLGVTQRITQVHRPRRVGIHIVNPSARNVFAGDGVIVDALVVVCRRLYTAALAVGILAAVVATVVVIAVVLLWRQLAGVCRAVRKRPVWERVLIAWLVAVLIAHGGSKPVGGTNEVEIVGGTNDVENGEAVSRPLQLGAGIWLPIRSGQGITRGEAELAKQVARGVTASPFLGLGERAKAAVEKRLGVVAKCVREIRGAL